MKRVVSILGFLVLMTAGTAQAQSHEGFWVGFGLGVGSLGVADATDRNTGVPDFAQDVRSIRRVASVQRHTVKGRGKPCRGLSLAQIVKALVGTLGGPFPGEHPRGILTFSSEWKDSRSKRELPG